MMSKIGFFTSSPSLFPLYHHYKLAPVSTSTYRFPHHIAIHPSNPITSSSPLIGTHNEKQSASHPPPTHLYTACRFSPPSLVQSIYPFLLSTLQFLPSVSSAHSNPVLPNIYTFCLTLTLDLTPSAWSVALLEPPNSPSLPSRYCLSTSAPSHH